MHFSTFQLPGLSHYNGFLRLLRLSYHLIKIFSDGWKQELDCACLHLFMNANHAMTSSDLSTLRFESSFAADLCGSPHPQRWQQKENQKSTLWNTPYVHAQPTIQNLTKIISVKRLYKIMLNPFLLCDT